MFYPLGGGCPVCRIKRILSTPTAKLPHFTIEKSTGQRGKWFVHGLSTNKGVVGSRGQISWHLAPGWVLCFQEEGLRSFRLRYAVGLTKVPARGEIIIQVTRWGLETQRTGNHLRSEREHLIKARNAGEGHSSCSTPCHQGQDHSVRVRTAPAGTGWKATGHLQGRWKEMHLLERASVKTASSWEDIPGLEKGTDKEWVRGSKPLMENAVGSVNLRSLVGQSYS